MITCLIFITGMGIRNELKTTIDIGYNIYLAWINPQKFKEKHRKRMEWYFSLIPFIKKFMPNEDSFYNSTKALFHRHIFLFSYWYFRLSSYV